jgi:hypothetical protein
LLSVSLVACTTARPLQFDSPAQLSEQVRPGDTVKIATYDGRKLKFEVTQVTDEAVVGEDVTVPLSEIRTIEKVEFSRSKTTIFGLSTTAVLLVVGGLIALIVAFSQADFSDE